MKKHLFSIFGCFVLAMALTLVSTGCNRVASEVKEEFDEIKQEISPDNVGEVNVTEDEAVDIALKDAGLTKDEVSFLNVILDYDDDTRIMEYDIDFNEGNTEYEYEINAHTGDIISKDKDID